ncbi:hypothetical protein KDA23_01945 [Candidatus Saccharibacteria bacterium]|nr:hypothetical protein [Candidatus Saccharibacteria bacterium]
MFKNPGKENFDSCQIRTVEFTEWSLVRGGKKSRSYVWKPRESVKNKTTRHDTQLAAKLHCPRTEDERVTIETLEQLGEDQADAQELLRSLAASTVCATCQFAGKTPVEVTRMRTELALAEKERAEAYLQRDEVVQQLMQIDPAYRSELGRS